MKELKPVFAILAAAFIGIGVAHAGQEGKGGNHLRDRALLAKQYARMILDTDSCASYFTSPSCKRMSSKLSLPLQWKEDSAAPLVAQVLNHQETVTAETTEELNSPIIFDLRRAEQFGMSFLEAVVFMIHEAGHVTGLSQSLITDTLVIDMLSHPSNEEDRRLFDQVRSAIAEDKESGKSLLANASGTYLRTDGNPCSIQLSTDAASRNASVTFISRAGMPACFQDGISVLMSCPESYTSCEGPFAQTLNAGELKKDLSVKIRLTLLPDGELIQAFEGHTPKRLKKAP